MYKFGVKSEHPGNLHINKIKKIQYDQLNILIIMLIMFYKYF